MKDQEMRTAANNLDRIESMLGRPVTGGTVDMRMLSQRPLTPSEIQHICGELDRIDFLRGKDTGHNTALEIKLFILYLVIGGIVIGIRKLFGLG